MMNTIMKFLLCMVFCFWVMGAFSQPRTKPKPPANKGKEQKPVRVRTKMNATYFVKDNEIKIRWAPVNEEGWRLCNLFGYVVERYTILKNNEIVSNPESFRLFGMVPDSLKLWMPIVDSNENAAVMAQALYGDEFQLDINTKTKAPNAGASLLSKAEENKQRFVFAMFAADLDYNVAEKAALAFTDKKVKPNEKYFYRIYPAAPKEYIKSDTALLYISLQDTVQLPKTAEINTEASNKSTVLTWDMERTKSYYNSFFIERKAEGESDFQPMNKIPYTSFSQPSNGRYGNAIVYTDTGLIDNGKYYYRVCGQTIFGQRGPWSDIVECKSLPLLEGVPGIQGIRLDEKGRAIVSWFFEDSIRPKVKAFELNYSESGSGDFAKVVSNIAPKDSEVYIPDSLASGYLIIKAVSIDGISRTSFPYLYQREDSTAPAPPTGVTATSDSTGVVTLKWLPNTEKDLLGYKVFRTIVQGAEKAVLVDTVWYSNVYKDTLDLKLKNRKAFYTVTALDTRFNQSKESKEVAVTKPDIIPPTAPVFEDYKLSEGAIEISWINSTDEDILETQLRRRVEGETDWKTVFVTKRNKDSKYVDKDVQPLKKYSYRLYSKDSANLVSQDAQELKVQSLAVVNRKAITKVEAQVDREKRLLYVSWQVDKTAAIKSIEIFRGENKEQITLYKVMDGKALDIIETELTVNTKYKYGVRALLKTGEYSDLIIKEVNY